MSRKSRRNVHKAERVAVDIKIGHTPAGEVVVLFDQPITSLRMSYEQAGNFAKQVFENAKAAYSIAEPPPAIVLPH